MQIGEVLLGLVSGTFLMLGPHLYPLPLAWLLSLGIMIAYFPVCPSLDYGLEDSVPYLAWSPLSPAPELSPLLLCGQMSVCSKP